jgi:hypothetical protein
MTLQLPPITEFCDGEKWLNLSGGSTPIHLHPMQRLILKAFYRGTEHNKWLTFTEEEEALIDQYGLHSVKEGPFNELYGVMGRRSGKGFLLAVITLYETAKLVFGPDPYERFKLSRGQPFTFLTVSNAAGQSAIARREVWSMMVNSPHFRELMQDGRVEGNKSTHINFLDPTKTYPVARLSFVLPNSESIIGTGCYALLLNEPAAFKSGMAEKVTTTMLPTLRTYHPEGKVVAFTGASYPGDWLHSAYTTPPKGRMTVRLSTWQANPKYTEAALRQTFSGIDDISFRRDFGAEFASRPEPEITEQVTFRLRVDLIDKLKRLARKKAYEQDEDISYTDIIRQILDDQLRNAV